MKILYGKQYFQVCYLSVLSVFTVIYLHFESAGEYLVGVNIAYAPRRS